MSAHADQPGTRFGTPQDGVAHGGGSGTVLGVLAEFGNEHGILAAAERVRDAGYRAWDTHTPYPVHGLEKAMGLRASPIPWIVLAAGITGAGSGLLMQWWMNAYDYALTISGKPLWSIPASIPVTFEVTILLSAFGAFFGMLALNGLPRFYHFAFHSNRFKRATQDRFFISIDARDPGFSAEKTARFLQGLGAASVEMITD